MSNIFALLILSFALCPTVFGHNPRPRIGLQEKREAYLNENYKVEWQTDFDDETIEFKVTVKTEGFVGFGISLAGKMSGADIIIGGVSDNGQTYFKDYFGDSPNNAMPKEDTEQNWELIEGKQTNGETILKFKRKLNTCDPNNEDVAITTGTLKFIWSIGATDTLTYHGTNRGALAFNILDPAPSFVDLSKFTVTHFLQPVTLTAKETIYWCSMFKRSSTKKSHIIAFEPKFDTPEALNYTHHFNMYTCKAPNGQNPDELFGKYTEDGYLGHDCLEDVQDPVPRMYCQSNLYAWSLGGRYLVFPDDIGFPWGNEETEYFMFEVHLNNPMKLSGILFETGISIYDTDVLREKEAGMLAIGHTTSPSLIVPPVTSNWGIVGHCSSDCTQNHFGKDGVNIFNINLHAHLSGRKMKVRQFRDGKELPWVMVDKSYDADYQENRPMTELTKILPGDHISLECTYDSNWKNGVPAIGGLATTDEMCMLFAFYYPKSSLENCFSGYSDNATLEYFGIESYEDGTQGSLDPIIILPDKWKGQTYSAILEKGVEWTTELKTNLQNKLLHENHYDFCAISEVKTSFFGLAKTTEKLTPDQQRSFPVVNYPQIDEEYKEPETCIQRNNSNITNAINIWLLFVFYAFIL